MQLKINKVLIIFAALLAVTGAALAQPESKSFIIAGISVDGNKFSDAQTIIALSGLRVGEQVTLPQDNKFQIAIKNLWLRKQFSHIEIVVEKVTPLGVFLQISVKEFPRLESIEIQNNDELSEKEIKESLGLMRGDILSKYEVYRSVKRLKRSYDDEGLMFADIETEIFPADSNNYSRVSYWIEEGDEFKVKSINFEGNNSFDDEELADALEETEVKDWWEFWKSGDFDRNKYDEDLKLIKGFYQSNGYIDAQVLSDSIIYNEEDKTVSININVFEGNRFYIRNIEFTGNTVYPSYRLINRLGFNTGDLYNKERFQMNLTGNENQSDALSLYLDNGYLRAMMDIDERRAEGDSIDIIIRVTEGSQFRVRKVEIVGNTKTKDKVIRRELYTRPGDYFNRSAVIRSVRALGVLQYFNPEALRPDVQLVDNTQVDLVYAVEERSTDTFNASIGYAGSFGFTGAIGFTFNNFSITEPIKGGSGQIFNFNWEFGQLSRFNNISFGFTEPWLFDEPNTVGVNIFDSRINYNFNLRRRGLIVNFGRRFHWPDDYFRGDWSLRLQENDVGETSAYSYYYRPGKNTEITLSQSFSRSSLNHLFFPTVGSRLSYTTTFAMGVLGLGTTDYFKNQVKYEMYHPLLTVDGNDKLVLYLSTNWGYITGFESDSSISPIELYYMGGNGLSGFSVTPLKGYDDRVVGPSAGGRVMAKHAVELRYALSLDPMPIYVYGFGEAGNVWHNLSMTEPFDLKRSAGIGLQIMIQQIGLIGFSYGYGFDPVGSSTSDSGWKFLFHLGNQ